LVADKLWKLLVLDPSLEIYLDVVRMDASLDRN